MTATATAERTSTPLYRMGPMLFDHAQVAMVTTTDVGVIVDANPLAAALFGRPPGDLAQEPIDRHVRLARPEPFRDFLVEAAGYCTPLTLGRGVIRRRSGPSVEKSIVLSSAFAAAGRPLLLVQFLER